jgi:hypothetical protein
MSGELLTVTFAANETKPFQKAGRYFEIIADGGSTVSVTFYGDNGAISANWNNIQSGIFIEDAWTQFTVTNNSAAAQTLTFLLMDNGRGGSRRQPGVVQVIDSDKSTTESGAAFMGVNSTGAVAGGQYGSLLLWNPAGSGKKIILERVYVDPAGATNIAAGIVNAITGVDAGVVGSKLSGGANSTAHIYTYGANVSDPASLMTGHQVWAPTIAAGAEAVLSPKRPIVLLPGYGFMVGARIVATAVTGTFEFWEQAL